MARAVGIVASSMTAVVMRILKADAGGYTDWMALSRNGDEGSTESCEK